VFFEWDKNKDRRNRRKHRISFHEAATALGDTLATTFPDAGHSEKEQRYLTIGMSEGGKILVVAHTEEGDNVRIISARRATPSERRFYEEES
jgi:uncharacterized DUF497 family protein